MLITNHGLTPFPTGFRTYQDSEVRIQPEALEGLAPVKEDVLAKHYPLLETAPEPTVETALATAEFEAEQPLSEPTITALDELFGTGADDEPEQDPES